MERYKKYFEDLVKEVPEEDWTKISNNGKVHKTIFIDVSTEDGLTAYLIVREDGLPIGVCLEKTSEHQLGYGLLNETIMRMAMMALSRQEKLTVTTFSGRDGAPLEIDAPYQFMN